MCVAHRSVQSMYVYCEKMCMYSFLLEHTMVAYGNQQSVRYVVSLTQIFVYIPWTQTRKRVNTAYDSCWQRVAHTQTQRWVLLTLRPICYRYRYLEFGADTQHNLFFSDLRMNSCLFPLQHVTLSTVTLAGETLDASVSWRLIEANRLWNMLFYDIIWPDVPTDVQYPFSFHLLINQESVKW